MRSNQRENIKQNIGFAIILIAVSLIGIFQLLTGKFEVTADVTSYFPLVSPVILLVGIWILVSSLVKRGQANAVDQAVSKIEDDAEAVVGPPLASDETHFLALLAGGMSDEEIAQESGQSLSRVKSIRTKLFHTFQVNRDEDLVWEAQKKGYLKKR